MRARPEGAHDSFLVSPLLRRRRVEASGVQIRTPAIAGQTHEDVISVLLALKVFTVVNGQATWQRTLVSDSDFFKKLIGHLDDLFLKGANLEQNHDLRTGSTLE